MATKPKNISLKKTPKPQKDPKSKFKDNLPRGFNKRKSRLQKIKSAFQYLIIKQTNISFIVRGPVKLVSYSAIIFISSQHNLKLHQ